MKQTLLCAVWLCCSALMAQTEQKPVNAPCVNEGFESMAVGTFTAVPGWTLGAGSYTGTSGNCGVYSSTAFANIDIMSVPAGIVGGIAPIVIPASPFSGTNVAYFHSPNSFKSLKQSFMVTATNAFYQSAYFGSSTLFGHASCCDQGFFRIRFYDCSNAALPTNTLLVAHVGPGALACNMGTIGMVAASSPTSTIYTPKWFIKNYDLRPYIGTCVTVVVENGRCSGGGHTQEMLFDSQCSASPFYVNGVYTGNTYVVCTTGTVALESAVANSYTWTGPGSFTSNSQTVSASASGVYTLSMDNLVDPPLTYTMNVTIAATPTISAVASSSVICATQPITLTASGTGITTYTWSSTGSTATTVVTPSATSLYTVTANSGTCPATATVSVKKVICQGIDEKELAGYLQIWPNPAQGKFTVRSTNAENLVVTDMAGRKLKELSVSKEGDYTVTVDDLPKGIYFISNKQRTYKVVLLE